MLTDYHSHILPGIDDGARDEAMSLAMLDMLNQQGVQRVIATPHFYAHREHSVEQFLLKRQAAFERIKSASPMQNILLGAEVSVEYGISELKDIEKLAIQGTKLILLELPYRKYEEWMSEEIYHISAGYGLKVILAHIHRYCGYYNKSEMQSILKTDAYFQINQDAFTHFKERNYAKSLIKQEYPIVFGSDCHNLTDRKPDWNIIRKGCKPEILEQSDHILEKHGT